MVSRVRASDQKALGTEHTYSRLCRQCFDELVAARATGTGVSAVSPGRREQGR